MSTLEYAAKSPEKTSEELSVSLERGLSSAEAGKRRAHYGTNELRAKGRTWWSIFLGQFRSPFLYLLAAAAAISAAVDDPLDAGIIVLYILINAALGFYQEFRSEQALRLLRQFLSLSARVRRDGAESSVGAENLVPGDVVILETGDVVPADVRIASAYDLAANESVLTGESASARKTADVLSKHPKDAYGASNIAFAGTTVASGKGEGIVVSTGASTSIGVIASLTVETEEESAFAKGISSFSKFILRLILLTIVFVFVANVAIKGGKTDIAELLVFSIALAVSVIPEALPVVSTLSLSRGALRLARENVVVKKLSAIEDMGSIEVLCTDKTGTLTENALSVSHVYGEKDDVLFYANLAATPSSRKLEPFDAALWQATRHEHARFERAKIQEELPFDPLRRRNTVLVETGTETELVSRGAFEAIVPLCAHMPDSERKKIAGWIEECGSYGERVLAVAHKKIEGRHAQKIEHLESGLEFAGLVSFLDPIKKTASSAVKKAKRLGLSVKIITGDSPEVAGAVAHSIGLVESPDEVIIGEKFMALPAHEQRAAAENYSVFARISPEQKFEIVRTLQETYEVGFLGEGINDAPALKAAGVGIVVKGASGVAQEAADIILLQKNLEVIVDGIKEGRVVFANTLKYLKATLASNFGNFYAIAIGSLFIDFLPMLPVQILLVNLLSDFPMIAIATDSVDHAEIGRPEKYRVHDIVVLATILGVVSTIFDFIFFAIYYRISPQALQTNWFMESVLTELVFLFSIRTRFPFFKGKRPSGTLLWLSAVAFAVTILLPFTDFGDSILHFLRPAAWQIETTLGIIAIYFASTEITKLLYYKFIENWAVRKND